MSHRKWNAWATVAVIGGAIGFGWLARAADPAPPAALHVGVVDAGKVYDQMNELKELVAAIRQKNDEYNAEGAKRVAELQGLTGQMKQFKEDSPQYNDLRKQVAEKNVALQVQKEVWQMELQRMERDALKTAHKRVVQASQEVAKDEHLDMVLSDANPDLSNANTDQYPGVSFKQLLLSRAVFYAGPNVDVTQKV